MAGVGLVVVFAEGRVQDPVAAVLDAPVLPDVALKSGGRFVETAEVVAHFPAYLVAVELGRLGFHVNQAAEIAPFCTDSGIHPVESMVDRDASRDDAAVGFFDSLVMTPALAVREIEIANGEVELILCFLVKVSLVAFEGEDVVRILFDDGLGDVGMSAHGIEGDDLPGQGENLDKMGDGGEFVAFIRYIFLSESESALRGPGAHDVAGFGIKAVAATQFLAVDGDDLALESGMECTDVFSQAAVEEIGLDDGEDVGESLGAGNSIGHFDPFAQPVALKVAEILNIGKAVHAAKHGADGHEEDFAEMMQLVAARARIFDDRE